MIKPGVWTTLLAGTIALAAAAAVSASPEFASTFALKQLTRAPASSTGFHTLMTWSDPGEPGGAPKAIEEIVLKFPRGSRFDTRALAVCEASDDQISSDGAAACPPASRVGAGHTNAVLGSAASFDTDVTLFNAPGQIIVLVTLHGTTTTLTEFRDQVRRRTVIVRPVLPSGVSLTRLDLTFDAHSSRGAGKRHAYLTTPPACPRSRLWTSRAKFTYADASRERLKSSARCRRSSARR